MMFVLLCATIVAAQIRTLSTSPLTIRTLAKTTATTKAPFTIDFSLPVVTYVPLPTLTLLTTASAATPAATPAPTPAPIPVLSLVGPVSGDLIYPGSLVQFNLAPIANPLLFAPQFMRVFVQGVECPVFFASTVAVGRCGLLLCALARERLWHLGLFSHVSLTTTRETNSPSTTLGPNDLLVRFPTIFMPNVTLVEVSVLGYAPIITSFSNIAFTDITTVARRNVPARNVLR